MQKKYFIIALVFSVLLGFSSFLAGYTHGSGRAENIDSGNTDVESGIDASQSAVSGIGEITGDQSGRIAELEQLNSELTEQIRFRDEKYSEAIGIIESLQSGQSGDNDLISNSQSGIAESIRLAGSVEERLQIIIDEIENMESDSND